MYYSCTTYVLIGYSCTYIAGSADVAAPHTVPLQIIFVDVIGTITSPARTVVIHVTAVCNTEVRFSYIVQFVTIYKHQSQSIVKGG